MSVLGRLANALDRNDEQPNVELAEALAASGDTTAIAELVSALTGPKPVARDAIKTLYEIGARRPELIAPHVDAFVALLGSSSNRLVWGALTALSSLALPAPQRIRPHLDAILDAADRGSVIAKDHANRILCALAAAGDTEAPKLAIKRLRDAAPNQFVTYAEEIAAVIDDAHRSALLRAIDSRRKGVTGAAKLARLTKLEKRLAR